MYKNDIYIVYITYDITEKAIACTLRYSTNPTYTYVHIPCQDPIPTPPSTYKAYIQHITTLTHIHTYKYKHNNKHDFQQSIYTPINMIYSVYIPNYMRTQERIL